jgi:hypothetical protein
MITTYAILDGDSRIISLHSGRESAEAAVWSYDKVIVELVRYHVAGDVVDHSQGVEIAADSSYPDRW